MFQSIHDPRTKERNNKHPFLSWRKKEEKKENEWCARCCKTLERQAGEAWKREPLEKLRSANFKFELKRKRERSVDSYTARLLASRQVASYFTRLTKNSRIRANVALRRQLKYLPRHNRVCGMSWRLVGTVGTRRNTPRLECRLHASKIKRAEFLAGASSKNVLWRSEKGESTERRKKCHGN